MFGDDEGGFAFGLFFVLFVFGVVFFADEEADDVGVLFDAAGIAQVAEALAVASISLSPNRSR